MRGSGADRGAVTQPALLPADPTPARPVVRCADCHRPLWTAEARAHGRGEHCREEYFAARRFEVAQEPLPGLADAP